MATRSTTIQTQQRRPKTGAAAPTRARPAKTAAKAVKKTATKATTAAKTTRKAVRKTATASSTEALTPLEKARLARANGTAKKSTSTKPTWQAPADFMPALYEVNFRTDKDGFLASKISALRIQGTYDKAPASARRKVDVYDPATLCGIAARIGTATYVANADNRLPANTQFRVLYRVGRRTADNTLSVTVRHIWIATRTKAGVVKPEELDRKDPRFVRIRRSTQFLPAVFATAIMPPKLGRGETE